MENLEYATSDKTFETWVNKDFIPEEMRSSLLAKSILIVPDLSYKDQQGPFFTNLAEEVAEYFRTNLPSDITFDICVGNESEELSLNSDYRRIGDFIVKEMALPIFLTVISALIYDKYIKPDENKPSINIIQNIDHSINNTIIQTNVPPVSPIHKELPPKPHKKILESTQITFSLTVEDSNGNSKEFYYKGPAKDVKAVTEQIKILWDGKDKTN
jgi:hypothetical protein